jgi:hypothetical protein
VRELEAFAARPDFQSFVAQVCEFPSVQGITIDIDPLWLHVAKLRQIVPSAFFDRVSERTFRGLVDALYFPFDLDERYFPWLPLDADSLTAPLDFNWLPDWWHVYCDLWGRPMSKSPIYVKIVQLPWQAQERVLEYGQTDFPVVKERRPQARLFNVKTPQIRMVGGMSIGKGPDISGTLGGIVEDSKKKRYGVTCSHVLQATDKVDQPALCDHSGARNVGSVVYSSSLQTSTSTTPCNPYNPGSLMNEVDAALIEFLAAHGPDLKIATLGPLSRIYSRADLQTGQRIYFVGKESGPAIQRLVVGGFNVTFRFKNDAGDYHCYKNTFEIRLPKAERCRGISPVQPGDSGAWLCVADATSYAWAGTVLGCHDDIAYAIFSEVTKDWIEATLGGTSISVI